MSIPLTSQISATPTLPYFSGESDTSSDIWQITFDDNQVSDRGTPLEAATWSNKRSIDDKFAPTSPTTFRNDFLATFRTLQQRVQANLALVLILLVSLFSVMNSATVGLTHITSGDLLDATTAMNTTLLMLAKRDREIQDLWNHLHRIEERVRLGEGGEEASMISNMEQRLQELASDINHRSGLLQALEQSVDQWMSQNSSPMLDVVQSCPTPLPSPTPEMYGWDRIALQDFITAIVNNSLAHYSKDTIGKRDHALGARIQYATPTYENPDRRRSWLSTVAVAKFLQRAFLGSTLPNGPENVLTSNLEPGQCWTLAGTRGRLVFLLPKAVYIDEISVDHAPIEMIGDAGTAPKEIRVAGSFYPPRSVEQFRTKQWSDQSTVNLGTFTYSVNSSVHIQTFSVNKYDLPIRVVVVDVLSNWGSNEYTCLYRIRVHGSSP